MTIVGELKATIPYIDKQIEYWKEFSKTNEKLQEFVSNYLIDNLKAIKGSISYYNDDNIEKLSDNDTLGDWLKELIASSLVINFLNSLDLLKSKSDDVLSATFNLEKLLTLNKISAGLLDDPEKLVDFLTNPKYDLDQLLRDHTVDSLLKKEFNIEIQAEQGEKKPQQKSVRQLRVEKLQATAANIDAQIADWEKFGEVHKELQEYISKNIIDNLNWIRSKVFGINEANIGMMSSSYIYNVDLKQIISGALVTKFVENQKLSATNIHRPYVAGVAVEGLQIIKDTCTNLLKDPDKLADFLTDPNSEFDRLLHDDNVNECLEKVFKNEIAARKAAELPKQKSAEQVRAEELKAFAQNIDAQIADWKKFGEAHQELQKYISHFLIVDLDSLKSGLVWINEGNIDNLSSIRDLNTHLKKFIADAVVVKFIDCLNLSKDAAIKAYTAWIDVGALSALNDTCAKLLGDSNELKAFLNNPNRVLEQLLENPDVKACLNEKFKYQIKDKKDEEQAKAQSAAVEEETNREEKNQEPEKKAEQLHEELEQHEEIEPENKEEKPESQEPPKEETEPEKKDEQPAEEKNQQQDVNDAEGKKSEKEEEKLKENDPEIIEAQNDEPKLNVEVKDPAMLLNTRIAGMISRSIEKLERAKTTVNSNQYKELIKYLKDFDTIKESNLVKLQQLGVKIDNYIKHKAADGVKANVYKKLAAVQETNVWVSQALKKMGVVRNAEYKDVYNAYKADKKDVTGLPHPGDVDYNKVHAEMTKLDLKITKDTVEAADNCMCNIILAAHPEKRSDLNKMRNTFNMVAQPTKQPVKTV